MEHSEIILIALILAIVFAGAQVEKVITLFRTSNKETAQFSAVKTVIRAQETTPVRKKTAPKKSAKPTTRKTSAKTSTKKHATTATKKTTAKK